MPHWNWHLALASDVLRIVNIQNKYDFLIGSLMPDTPWVTGDDIYDAVDRCLLHCFRNDRSGYFNVADCTVAAFKYKDNIRSMDLYKGLLTHVILDELVNSYGNMKYTEIDSQHYILIEENKQYTLSSKDFCQKHWDSTHSYPNARFPNVFIDFEEHSYTELTKSAVVHISKEFGQKGEIGKKIHDNACNALRQLRSVQPSGESWWDDYDRIHKCAIERSVAMLHVITK